MTTKWIKRHHGIKFPDLRGQAFWLHIYDNHEFTVSPEKKQAYIDDANWPTTTLISYFTHTVPVNNGYSFTEKQCWEKDLGEYIEYGEVK